MNFCDRVRQRSRTHKPTIILCRGSAADCFSLSRSSCMAPFFSISAMGLSYQGFPRLSGRADTSETTFIGHGLAEIGQDSHFLLLLLQFFLLFALMINIGPITTLDGDGDNGCDDQTSPRSRSSKKLTCWGFAGAFGTVSGVYSVISSSRISSPSAVVT
jgi:hypothetical protein